MFISVIAANFTSKLKLAFLLFIRFVSITLVLNQAVWFVLVNAQTSRYEIWGYKESVCDITPCSLVENNDAWKHCFLTIFHLQGDKICLRNFRNSELDHVISNLPGSEKEKVI